MNNPFPELNTFLENYNSVISTVQSKAIFVRAIEKQKEQISILDKLIQETEFELVKAQDEKNNNKANLLFCLKLSASAIKKELLLLINLKEDNTDIAWQCLIDAQNEISIVMRNHPYGGDYLNGYSYRLYTYEKLLFPSMYFASRGCVVSKSKCSICKLPLEDCNHIKGYVYMGDFCSEIIEKIESIDEISIVENPADKSCRILSFDKDGKSYDVFTHREIEKSTTGNNV